MDPMDEDLIRIANNVAIALGRMEDDLGIADIAIDLDDGDYPVVKFYEDEYGHEVTLVVAPGA